MTKSSPADQQIRDFRALFKHLVLRYAWLANTFAMLAPLLEDERLKARLAKSNELAAATSPVARVLFNSCLLDTHTLLRDSKPTNPSLLTLVRPFLRGNRRKNTDLLDRLTTLYSKNETRRQKFWDAVDALADDSAEKALSM